MPRGGVCGAGDMRHIDPAERTDWHSGRGIEGGMGWEREEKSCGGRGIGYFPETP